MLRVLIIGFGLLCGAAFAQQADQADGGSAGAVEVTGDSLSIDQKSGRAMFSGNVVIGQGDMRVAADEVEIEYSNESQDRIRAMHARGNVTLVIGPDAAEADEAIYLVQDQQVTLIGDVLLKQGGNILSGDKVEIDILGGTARVDGRVRSILQPDRAE